MLYVCKVATLSVPSDVLPLTLAHKMVANTGMVAATGNVIVCTAVDTTVSVPNFTIRPEGKYAHPGCPADGTLVDKIEAVNGMSLLVAPVLLYLCTNVSLKFVIAETAL